MLHGMINEQGLCIDDISERKEYFYMFSSQSLVAGALILLCVQEFSEQRFFAFISLCAD